MKHIELFAGCGGLSLGLESVGFEMVLANELSPMASETFSYNFFGQDLAAQAAKPTIPQDKLKAKWLSSNFSASQLAQRLREDPRTYPDIEDKANCDITSAADLKGTLVVGSITHLNQWLAINQHALYELANGFDGSGIDLVSGGPPCQSFSMAGMREFSNSRNVLPWEFARFVGMVKPRFALLENVTGILRPFEVDGKKVYAWFEVAKAFAEVGYVPLCLHINAKDAGVAQNRPRFIMVLFRHDVYQKLKPTFNSTELGLLRKPESFYKKVKKASEEIVYEDLEFHDVKDPRAVAVFHASFLAPLVRYNGKHFGVGDAIEDIKGGIPKKSKKKRPGYLGKLDELAPFVHGVATSLENHELRRNGDHVRRRFRIYQVLQTIQNKKITTEVQQLLNGTGMTLSQESVKALLEHEYLKEDGTLGKFKSKASLVKFLLAHPTRKQTQKALDPALPAPAALSIPDDACHYDPRQLRTLSVREMARIQSFPDNFAFRSKVTTGGQMRKFEVPQYTQVGNAVPPLLGHALGLVFRELGERFHNNAPRAGTKAPVIQLEIPLAESMPTETIEAEEA